MKFAKRLLSAVLVCSVLLTCFVVMPVSAAFTDVKDTDRNAQAITVLNKLGIINGYDDGSFKPNNNVTRAEFTAMLLRTRGMGTVGSTSLENPPFPDVTTPDVSWAIANIRTAREMGIINGYDDGTFKPNNNVTYQEAVKMIVCALGYGEMGVEGPEWYSKYMVSAQTLGFINGAGGTINAPATRETIAVMLYNCLEVYLAENNEVTEKTILEDDLKLTKRVGYIDSTPEISLSQPDSNLRDDEVQITVKKADGTFSTDTYKTDNAAQYADMLGAQITFYYNFNRSTSLNTLVFATVKNTDTIEIEADQIADVDSTSISYYRNESSNRSITVNVAADSVVVYNNRLFGATKDASTFAAYYAAKGAAAAPSIGKIKLLDRDNDNNYDVVFVDSYEAWFVSSATSSNKTVTDNVLRKGLTNDETKLVLEEVGTSTEIIIRKEDGTETTFSSITRGSILCVKESNANGGVLVKEVVICNKPVSGTITSTNTKTGVTINGVTYKFSRQAPWEDDAVSSGTGLVEPVQGDGGKFYLDIDGNIIAYDKTEETTNQLYGYIVGAKYDPGVIEGESLKVQIFDENGKLDIYTIDTRSKIDGTPYTSLSDANSALLGTAKPATYTSVYSQLVKFTTSAARGSNVIDEIITANVTSEKVSKVSNDKLNLYNDISKSESFEYNSTNKQFYRQAGSSKKMVNLHNAKIIILPTAETNEYRKITYSSLRADTNYNIEVFDITTTNAAQVVLIHGTSKEVGDINTDSPVLVITEEPIWNGERWTLEGYVGTSKKTYELSNEDTDTLTVADESGTTTLKKGDVVRIGTDSKDYATVKDANKIFSTAANFRAGKTYPKEETDYDGRIAYRVLWGSMYTVDDELTLTYISDDVLEAGDTAGIEDAYQIDGNWYSGAQLFTFDLSATAPSDFITVHETSENRDLLTGLAQYDNGATRPAEIFVYAGASSVKTVIIVIR